MYEKDVKDVCMQCMVDGWVVRDGRDEREGKDVKERSGKEGAMVKELKDESNTFVYWTEFCC